MKILVADKISEKGVAFLKAQEGLEVIVSHNTPPAKLLEIVRDVSAILVRSETKISREVIEAAPALKVVGRAGVGVDNVDVDAATERGVVVMNTPSGNTIATAELTFTHMLCTARPVPQAAQSMREGKWDRKSFSGSELYQKTLGVLGLGRIGTEVARRAQAFGMRVLAYDPYLAPSRAKALQVEPCDLDTIFREADFITVHMPLTDQTRNMIDARAFEIMKKGVRIINCARGGLVNEAALIEALKAGKVGAAGFDVFENEPLAADSELRKLPNVTLTPHLGASTAEAQETVGIEIAEQVFHALKGGIIRNAVNMPTIDAQTLKVLGPYLDLGAKLGTLVQQIAPPQIDRLRLSYWGKVVDLDANALTRAIQRGFLRRIAGEEVNFVNAPLHLQRLGVQVEVIKSTSESDYTELIQVEAIAPNGKTYSAAGTLIGKINSPRITAINGREVEAVPGTALVLIENDDRPGMIGIMGTLLGKFGVNIASMSLSREQAGGRALVVLNVDSAPNEDALNALRGTLGITSATLVHF
jgi:D-3-phosphoglycerate dehydrogenase